MTFWRGVVWGAGAVAGLGAVGAGLLARPLLNRLVGGTYGKIMGQGKYDENIGEMLPIMTGRHPRVLLETSLRAERGMRISRPLYTSKQFIHFDDLMFIPAQMAKLPTNENARIDLTTVIGPRAEKPLKLDMPMIISGMAFGLSLTDRCKIALAKGASEAGTATNSGEGGFYEQEREHAKHYILQYTRGGWPSDPEILKRADAIEIQVGQGAQAGSPQITPGWKLTDEERKAMGLDVGQDALLHSRFPGVDSPADFPALVARIRQEAGGIPVGVKIAAGHHIEADIQVAIDSGVDFVTVDGAQAASHAAEPILLDDFGIPSLVALCRAARVLKGTDITLIVSGGFMTPGEILKALALGADVVAMGTAPLWASIHAQWQKIAPLEPPTTLVLHDGKHRDKFDVEEGARDVANWFWAMADELVTGVRCVGKEEIHAVNREDLCALTPELATITGLPLAWGAPAAETEARPAQPPEVRRQASAFPRKPEAPPPPLH